MWLEAFNQLQKKRVYYFIRLVVIFSIITALVIQWHKVNEKAEQTQLRMLVQTLTKSASTLRQGWELNNKPEQSIKDGVGYSFTRFGWPIVVVNNQINCEKTWVLLSPRLGAVKYIDMVNDSGYKSTSYDFCFYQISDGKWLALFYENETIRIDGFLTRPR